MTALLLPYYHLTTLTEKKGKQRQGEEYSTSFFDRVCVTRSETYIHISIFLSSKIADSTGFFFFSKLGPTFLKGLFFLKTMMADFTVFLLQFLKMGSTSQALFGSKWDLHLRVCLWKTNPFAQCITIYLNMQVYPAPCLGAETDYIKDRFLQN